MTQEELYTVVHKQPFEPFRVVLTTGTTYDVRHPDLIMVGKRSATIGTTNNPEAKVYDLTVKVDLLHVVAIEELPVSPSSANGTAS
jgi:hypothetical protein